MEIQICANCKTRVQPKRSGQCPACQSFSFAPETEPTTNSGSDTVGVLQTSASLEEPIIILESESPSADDQYLDLPWYRKSSYVSPLTLLGLCFGPAILVVCLIVLTGDVYYDKIDSTGKLQKWGGGNKVAAIIILGVQSLVTAYQLGAFSGTTIGR